MKKLIFMFIMVHSVNGGDVSINTDQVSMVGEAPGLSNICGNHTMVRFYNGDSACIIESPVEVNALITNK